MSDRAPQVTDPVPIAPGRWPLLGHALALRERPWDFMTSLGKHGRVVRIFVGTLPVYVLTDAALAYRVLATEANSFAKGLMIEKFRPYLGNGLGLSSGDFYRRQRRLVQPALHHRRIAKYAETMIGLATSEAESWAPGAVIAVEQRMRELSLIIAGRTLFSTDFGREAADEVVRSVPSLIEDGLIRAFSPKVLERLPIPAYRRFDLAIARIRQVVTDVVTKAREDGTDHGDLLSMLLLARDEDTGEGMTDEQIHDEVVTLLTAGTDTTAVTMSWFFHEIARHPEVERRFHAEVDEVIGRREITVEDIPKLTYTQQIISEVLRLHGVWLLMRKTLEDVDLGEVFLPAGTEVGVSPHALHQDPAVFPDPERFDPDRWTPDRARAVPKHAYIPFATGMHMCPGYSFAQAETATIAAAVGTRWRLVPVPGKPVGTKVTAFPVPNGLPMTAVPRHN